MPNCLLLGLSAIYVRSGMAFDQRPDQRQAGAGPMGHPQQPLGARCHLCQMAPFRGSGYFTYARGQGRSSSLPSSPWGYTKTNGKPRLADGQPWQPSGARAADGCPIS